MFDCTPLPARQRARQEIAEDLCVGLSTLTRRLR